MGETPTPQESGCKTIVFDSHGVCNGFLTMVADFYEIEYNEEKEQYEVTTW